jgi:predicted metal-dependent phosphoesterase TrpH
MPGYEPFLLCDFHVHTRWSDGRLSLREVVDLYGKTGRFDVIAITDHILILTVAFAIRNPQSAIRNE